MRRLLLLVVVLLFPTLSAAQPLADRVPADALLYVGWVGSDNLGPAFDESHLKAVLQSSGARELFAQTLPQLSQRAAQGQPGVAEYVTLLSAIGERVWRHPAALFWTGVDFSDPRNPAPRFALVCDAGDEAASLTKDFQTAVDRAGRTAVPMKVVSDKNIVALHVGGVPAGVAGQPSLTEQAAVIDAMTQVHDAPLACVYVNLEGIVKLIDSAPVRGKRQEADREKWDKLRDALGLANAKVAMWTGAFDGKDWSGRAFVAAPAPRTGIFAMLDGRPITADLLALVPSTATMMRACNLDLARIIPAARDTAAKVDPNAPANIDQGLDRFRTMTGLDLQKDVFEPLGDQWAVYADPTVAGNFTLSLVLVNKLDDPAKADRAIAQLARSAGNFASGAAAKDGVQVAFRDVKVGDVTVHYLATPLVRPSWTIKDGVLYAGLYPQVVAAAAGTGAKGKSIVDNDAFIAVRKRVGGDHAPTSIQFGDLQKIAPSVYPTWLLLTSYAGFGDLFGVQTPPMLLPPLDRLLAHLAPSASVSWVDGAGWHMQGVTPFPGANVVASDPTLTIIGPGVLGGTALPALGRGRDVANQVKCGQQLHQIGRAIQLHANENKGAYPPDLGTLVATNKLPIDLFVCPASGETIPPDIKTGTPEAQAAWVNANSSYVFNGRGLTLNSPAESIVVYEKDDNHGEAGMNLLYGDGHVEWQPVQVARQLIRNAQKRE
jgi:prepilin-type processing-associated H-X9-DG protein